MVTQGASSLASNEHTNAGRDDNVLLTKIEDIAQHEYGNGSGSSMSETSHHSREGLLSFGHLGALLFFMYLLLRFGRGISEAQGQ